MSDADIAVQLSEVLDRCRGLVERSSTRGAQNLLVQRSALCERLSLVEENFASDVWRRSVPDSEFVDRAAIAALVIRLLNVYEQLGDELDSIDVALFAGLCDLVDHARRADMDTDVWNALAAHLFAITGALSIITRIDHDNCRVVGVCGTQIVSNGDEFDSPPASAERLALRIDTTVDSDTACSAIPLVDRAAPNSGYLVVPMSEDAVVLVACSARDRSACDSYLRLLRPLMTLATENNHSAHGWHGLLDHISAELRRDRGREALFGEPAADLRLMNLTRREREVLLLVSRGASNAEIAKELVVSTDTAKSHLKNIFRKAGVSNRAELISYVSATRSFPTAGDRRS